LVVSFAEKDAAVRMDFSAGIDVRYLNLAQWK
jgi:hypothetical protein